MEHLIITNLIKSLNNIEEPSKGNAVKKAE